MPPTKRFQREEIIQTAYKIVEKDGLDSLNARKIAKKMGGSVQPIYHNFSTMEELKQEVFYKIYAQYQKIMIEATDQEHPYLAKGLAYIKFAKEYPEFFKAIYMRESSLNAKEFFESDQEMMEDILSTITKKFDISKEDLKEFHFKVWIFTHGLACLFATKTVHISEKEAKEILLNMVEELFKGYQKGVRK